MSSLRLALKQSLADAGTLVNEAAGGGARDAVVFGHPSGTLRVGAEVEQAGGQWAAPAAIMSRSARVLMSGQVHVPAGVLDGG